MSGNRQSQAEMAREVKLVTTDFARALSNVLNTAAEGLLDRQDMKPDLQAETRHGFGN